MDKRKTEYVNIRIRSVIKEDFSDICSALGTNMSVSIRNFIQGVNHLSLKEASLLLDKLDKLASEHKDTAYNISTKSV